MKNEMLKIGFMGSAGRGKELPQDLLKLAKGIGKAVAKANCVLITGACMGLPHEATLSAIKAGGKVIGYSPAKNLLEHQTPPISYPMPPVGMEVIFTGLGKNGRIPVCISACDGVIICSGHLGTAIEFLMAYQDNKVIGLLKGSGGIADCALSLLELVSKKTNAVIVSDSDPEKLVKRVIGAITAQKA